MVVDVDVGVRESMGIDRMDEVRGGSGNKRSNVGIWYDIELNADRYRCMYHTYLRYL
jgi:hypothetical protein